MRDNGLGVMSLEDFPPNRFGYESFLAIASLLIHAVYFPESSGAAILMQANASSWS